MIVIIIILMMMMMVVMIRIAVILPFKLGVRAENITSDV